MPIWAQWAVWLVTIVGGILAILEKLLNISTHFRLQPGTLYWLALFFILAGGLGISFSTLTPESKPHPSGEMIFVAPGFFYRGTTDKEIQRIAGKYDVPANWFMDETPRAGIHVSDFWIDKYEVTNEKYKMFVDKGFGKVPRNWIANFYPVNKKYHPVIDVSWYDAGHYCVWAGKRLPTEEEWEKAARGPNNYEFPWGDKFEIEKANVKENQIGGTTAIGVYGANKSGYEVFDMSGNVYEWTSSSYTPYEGSNYVSERFGEEFRVARGGSWRDPLVDGRAASRRRFHPWHNSNDIGFRCAK